MRRKDAADQVRDIVAPKDPGYQFQRLKIVLSILNGNLQIIRFKIKKNLR